MDLSIYTESNVNSPKLTLAFYNLSLTKKYEVINYMISTDFLFGTPNLYDKVVKAILQHSPDTSKEYSVKGVRKIRPEARKADREEHIAAITTLTEAIQKGIKDGFQP